MANQPKEFDCVEMKRRGAEIVRERTRGMTRDQELAFWREQTEKLRRRQKAARERAERTAG